MRRAAPFQEMRILGSTEPAITIIHGGEVGTGQPVQFSINADARMFPNEFLRHLNLALPSPESERPTDSTTRHASLGSQIGLGILARLETRHTTPDGKLEHRETANSGFQGIMPWLVMRRKHIPA